MTTFTDNIIKIFQDPIGKIKDNIADGVYKIKNLTTNNSDNMTSSESKEREKSYEDMFGESTELHNESTEPFNGTLRLTFDRPCSKGTNINTNINTDRLLAVLKVEKLDMVTIQDDMTKVSKKGLDGLILDEPSESEDLELNTSLQNKMQIDNLTLREKGLDIVLKKKYEKDNIINTSVITGGATTGAIVGSIFGPLGSAIGAGIGIGSGVLVVVLKDLI